MPPELFASGRAGTGREGLTAEGLTAEGLTAAASLETGGSDWAAATLIDQRLNTTKESWRIEMDFRTYGLKNLKEEGTPHRNIRAASETRGPDLS
jgi:hypothetical protein